MEKNSPDRDQLLSILKETVAQAVTFFSQVDENFFDGHQTAHAVLSHLVFWHRAYCSISQAILLGQEPVLLKGSLEEFNEKAACEFAATCMPDLAACLADYQAMLTNNLRNLSDWEVNFPFKAGCRQTNVTQRLYSIINHINHHLSRQKRAYARGEAWIKAYYPESFFVEEQR